MIYTHVLNKPTNFFTQPTRWMGNWKMREVENLCRRKARIGRRFAE